MKPAGVRFHHAALSVLFGFALTACVSQPQAPLDLSLNDTTETVSTPSHAVLAGADAAELANDTSAFTTQTGIQTAANIPQPNPRKQAGDTVISTNLPPENPSLAAIENIKDNDPAETTIQVAALQQPADNATTNIATGELAIADPAQDASPAAQPAAVERQEKKAGFFTRLFGAHKTANRPRRNRSAFANRGERHLRTGRADGSIVLASAASRIKKDKPVRPKIQANATARNSGNSAALDTALPGVKSNAEIFGIEDAEVEESINGTQVASVGSFGRLSPNGLRVQHAKVQVDCLKPGVIRILKMVERRYGKKPIITSGFRSPKRNRKAGGARQSQHIFCKAADIQVEGISKWDLAKYLRSIPGRGGVGTYCRTKSVHFDIGSERDWHHPCRRSSVKKRKKA